MGFIIEELRKSVQKDMKQIGLFTGVFSVNILLFLLSRVTDDTVNVLAKEFIFGTAVTVKTVLMSIFIAFVLHIIVRFLNILITYYIIREKVQADYPIDPNWASFATMMSVFPVLFHPILGNIAKQWLLLTNMPLTAAVVDLLFLAIVYEIVGRIYEYFTGKKFAELLNKIKIFPTNFKITSAIFSIIVGLSIYKFLLLAFV